MTKNIKDVWDHLVELDDNIQATRAMLSQAKDLKRFYRDNFLRPELIKLYISYFGPKHRTFNDICGLNETLGLEFLNNKKSFEFVIEPYKKEN